MFCYPENSSTVAKGKEQFQNSNTELHRKWRMEVKKKRKKEHMNKT